MSRHLLLLAAALIPLACRRPPQGRPAPSAPNERTVFTDSLLHAEQCEALKAGEDWRRVCTPRSQPRTSRRIPPAPPRQPK